MGVAVDYTLDGQPWCEGPDGSRKGGDRVDKGFPDVDKNNILLITDVTLDECVLCVRFGAMGFTHSISASSHNNPEGGIGVPTSQVETVSLWRKLGVLFDA